MTIWIQSEWDFYVLENPYEEKAKKAWDFGKLLGLYAKKEEEVIQAIADNRMLKKGKKI